MLPSQSEGIPAALVEATAVGLPSVVSDIPGTEIIVDHIHGIRTPADNAASLAASLAELLLDHVSRQRMGSAARNMFLSAYTLERVAGDHEQLYWELLHTSLRSEKRIGTAH